MKIKKFFDFNFNDQIIYDFINNIGAIKESGKFDIKSIQNKVLKDLKLNTELALTFGAGIGAFYPIVSSLIKNMKLDSIEVTPDVVVLLTISSITIIYLEEKKSKSTKEEARLTADSKSMLEELKLRGIGNGIVKKIIKCIKSIKNIVSIIIKHSGSTIGSVIDMFAYTSLMIPILNGINYIIGKYNMNIETLPKNFLGLAIGIGTVVTKHALVEILKRIKGRISDKEKEIINDIEVPTVHKFSDFKKNNELINEEK